MIISITNADIESHTTIKFLLVSLHIGTVLNNEINNI